MRVGVSGGCSNLLTSASWSLSSAVSVHDQEAPGSTANVKHTEFKDHSISRQLPNQASVPRTRVAHAMPLLASALLVFAAAIGSVGGFIAGTAMGNAFTLPLDAPEWGALEAAYNASVVAAAPGGTWPEGQVKFADSPPQVCWSVGHIKYGTDCTPNTERDTPTGVLPGGGCSSTGFCWVRHMHSHAGRPQIGSACVQVHAPL